VGKPRSVEGYSRVMNLYSHWGPRRIILVSCEIDLFLGAYICGHRDHGRDHEDAHRMKKRQRGLSNSDAEDGEDGDGDGPSRRKRLSVIGSGAGVGEHPRGKGVDSSGSRTDGHARPAEPASSDDETVPPPRVT
jgi:hypothetical protein